MSFFLFCFFKNNTLSLKMCDLKCCDFKFQKYALGSLQQLLADNPPAPVGQDPDEGSSPA